MSNFLSRLCAAALLLPAQWAMAYCNVPQPRLVCAEYYASQLVVEATLVKIRTLHDKDDPEGISAHVYTLSVDRVLRGKAEGRIRIYEGNDSGRATFDWVQGKRYLLFLYYASYDRALELDGCGNSGPLDESKHALSEIAAIKSAHDAGFIHGVVVGMQPSSPLAGVHLEADGSRGRFAAITDKDGKFQIKVPVGQYSIRVVEHGRHFGEAGFNYENPASARIYPGGCVQVQFGEMSGTQ